MTGVAGDVIRIEGGLPDDAPAEPGADHEPKSEADAKSEA
jgi:hypothetical protein